MSIVLAGFFLGLSLIVAVGPQNAMLLKFGIRR
ncbi:MAG: amino acid transporter, partial [Corynebacterium sp.]|nr:amino acid transporter [Corynebacterium sp.]